MTNQFIGDVLVAAFEGGSNYWIEGIEILKDVPDTKYLSDVVAKGGSLIIEDEDGKKVLTAAKMRKGINMALSGRMIKEEDYDSYDADSALQYALFGELVYG